MRWFNYFFVVIILSIILSPIIFMGLFSFSENRFIAFPVTGYSVKWYVSVFNNPVVIKSLGLTLFIATIVSAVSVCLGFMSGYWLSRSGVTNKQLILSLFTIPAVVPFVLFGLGFLEFANYAGFGRTIFAIIIAQTVVFSPLATVYFYHQINRLNPDIENSARELGCPELRVIIEIVAGQLIKNAFVCMAVVFALSWDEYIISWFVGGFQKTYAVQVRNMLESTFSPEVFAIGSVIGLGSLIILSLAIAGSKKELLVD